MFDDVNLMPATYVGYLLIGIGLTIWVARTLRVRGRVFIAKGCKGNDELADSLSHLFSVGFYLLHVGFVLLALKLGGYAFDTVEAIELLSTKVGLVLVVLGVSLFVHLTIYCRIHGKPRSATRPAEGYPTMAELVES